MTRRTQSLRAEEEQVRDMQWACMHACGAGVDVAGCAGEGTRNGTERVSEVMGKERVCEREETCA